MVIILPYLKFIKRYNCNLKHKFTQQEKDIMLRLKPNCVVKFGVPFTGITQKKDVKVAYSTSTCVQNVNICSTAVLNTSFNIRLKSKILSKMTTLTSFQDYCSKKNFSTTSLACRKTKTNEIVESSEKSFSELTLGEKVKQTGKDATYTGVIILGVGITGLMFYMIGRELFSKQSPSGVYGVAVKELRKLDKVVDIVGEPVKAYGEMTRRGRRRHVSHIEWCDNDGKKHMRMKFYIEGPLNKGTAHLEVCENDAKKFDYRYLFVEFEGYPPRVVVVHDNR